MCMDMESSPSTSVVKCCDCGCDCDPVMNRSLSGTWLRSVKRKFNEYEDGGRLFIPGLSLPQVARVDAENEVTALREVVSSQQEMIQGLYVELDQERSASSSAANEAMSMILRLQSEKAEIEMELRQFKRFADEKIAHDQQEIFALEDLLYKREQAIQSLTCEVQAYKHRMMSYGLTESEADGEGAPGSATMSRNNSSVAIDNPGGQFDFPAHDYPPLKCNMNEFHVFSEVDNEAAYDVEKYAFGETPQSRDHLRDLEDRIDQLERTPRSIQSDREFVSSKNVFEKVIVGQSPRKSRLWAKLSPESICSLPKDMGPVISTDSPGFGGNTRKAVESQTEEYSDPVRVDNTSDLGDDTSDRVYTIDSVHQGVPYNVVAEPEPKSSVGINDDYMTTPRESLNHLTVEDPDIQKLYMRLQVLEADKESMRQAIISMRTDKAQMILLKEIAQHLSKEMSSARKEPVSKPSPAGSSIFKWVSSVVSWKKKAQKPRYPLGTSPHNAGLLCLLDKAPSMRSWRCLSSTQV